MVLLQVAHIVNAVILTVLIPVIVLVEMLFEAVFVLDVALEEEIFLQFLAFERVSSAFEVSCRCYKASIVVLLGLLHCLPLGRRETDFQVTDSRLVDMDRSIIRRYLSL